MLNHLNHIYIYIFVFLISDYILYSILFIIYKKMFLHGMYKYIYIFMCANYIIQYITCFNVQVEIIIISKVGPCISAGQLAFNIC